MSRDRLRLLHIRDAIVRINSYVSNRKAFMAETVVQDAVIRNLEIIGEAVKALDPQTQSYRPDIPWTNIAGMRDRLIHGYFAVDLELVWDVVAEDLGPLEAAVDELLGREKE